MTSDPATYPGYRFPAEIIGHAVWLYHVFSLSAYPGRHGG
jgi:putative transposase